MTTETASEEYLKLGVPDCSGNVDVVGGRLKVGGGVNITELIVRGGAFNITKRRFLLNSISTQEETSTEQVSPVVKNTLSRSPAFEQSLVDGDIPLWGAFHVKNRKDEFYSCVVDTGIMTMSNGEIQSFLISGFYATGIMDLSGVAVGETGVRTIEGYDTFSQFAAADISGNPLTNLAELDVSGNVLNDNTLNECCEFAERRRCQSDPSGNHVIHLSPFSSPFNNPANRMGVGRDNLTVDPPWLGQPLSGNDVFMMGSAIDYSEDIADTVLQAYDGIQCTEKVGKDGRKYFIFSNGTDAPVVVSVFVTAADTMVSFCNLLLSLKQFLGLTEAVRIEDDTHHKLPTEDIRDMRLPGIDEITQIRFRATNGVSYTAQNLRMETFLKILTDLTERYYAPIVAETPLADEVLQPM